MFLPTCCFALLLVEHEHLGVGQDGCIGNAFQRLEEHADVVGDHAQVEAVAAKLRRDVTVIEQLGGGGVVNDRAGEGVVDRRMLGLGPVFAVLAVAPELLHRLPPGPTSGCAVNRA